MDFYERKRRASLDIKSWIISDQRQPFGDFARVILHNYGFDVTATKKILAKNYGLEVTDDGELKKVE